MAGGVWDQGCFLFRCVSRCQSLRVVSGLANVKRDLWQMKTMLMRIPVDVANEVAAAIQLSQCAGSEERSLAGRGIWLVQRFSSELICANLHMQQRTARQLSS